MTVLEANDPKLWQFEAAYTGDFVSVLEGGIEQKSGYLGNLDLVFGFDFNKILPWQGLTAQLYILGNHGDESSKFVGDTLISSNIESPEDYLKVYQAWLQQDIADFASILFGMHDLNSEFYVTGSSAAFLNSNFGIGIELAQTGENGPSIFPQTSPAVRLALYPFKSLDIRLAAYNARAGNPASIKQSYARYDPEDGLLTIAELSYLFAEQSKISFGSWSYSKKSDRIDGSGRDNNRGNYALIDGKINPATQFFFRYGTAAKDVNAVASSLAVGVYLSRLFTIRPDDALGLAFTKAEPSTALGSGFEAEEVIELSYEIALYEHLSLQPDLQLIRTPSFTGQNSDATVLTLRIGLSI